MRALVGIAVGFVLGLTDAHAGVVERVGRAYDRDTEKYLYSETHRDEYTGERLTRSTVEYRTPAGETFAQKVAVFASDPLRPRFRLENFATGHVEEARPLADRCEVWFRRSDDHEPKTGLVPMPETAIIDVGFRRFITEHWAELLTGSAKERAYLVPVRLAFIDLRVQQTRVEEVNERIERTFTIEPPSPLLRLVAPKLEMVFDDATRELLRYEGLSNLRNTDGKNYWVRVDYSTPSAPMAATR